MGLFHRGKKNNDDEPDSVQTNSFSDIMNGLQYAVNCAQDTLQNHQIQNLTRLFEGTNANNANTFQSKKIMVGDKTIDIPLIALISHHYLAMDNVQIKFKAKVGSVESQIPENNLLLSSPHRANLQMQMSNIKPDTDDVMEVCVNFKVQETPESISRIIGNYSAPIEVSPIGMRDHLTVLQQQELHCISNFRSSWRFLRWSVTWQNHRHRCQFGSNR